MTTGKHADVQSLQNSDGTFELVVSPSEVTDDWSETDLPSSAAVPPARAFPIKQVTAGVVALGLVLAVGFVVKSTMRKGVLVDDEPLPVVTGFRPYTGGSAAASVTPSRSRTAVRPADNVDEEEFTDDEREIVVEHGEPAEAIAEVAEPEVIRDESPEESAAIEVPTEEEAVVDDSHEIEPRAILPTGIDANRMIQRDLSRQLKAMNRDVKLPMATPM